jgi:hypothetical protein
LQRYAAVECLFMHNLLLHAHIDILRTMRRSRQLSRRGDRPVDFRKRRRFGKGPPARREAFEGARPARQRFWRRLAGFRLKRP